MQEIEKETCVVCKGNHYYVDEDQHIHDCPECTLQGYQSEPKEEIPNESV